MRNIIGYIFPKLKFDLWRLILNNKLKKLMHIAFHKSGINQIDNIPKKLVKMQIIVIINITDYNIEIEKLILRFPLQKIVHSLTEHGYVVALS